MKNVDIAKFEFDFDLVFAVMFTSANDHVYSRYGSRTALNSASRYSLEGLKFTMRQVLSVHDPRQLPMTPVSAPTVARDLRPGRGGCMHCHQVWEGLRHRSRRDGQFDPRSLFVYPLPENIGLRLEVDAGNQVSSVKAKSACGQVDIRPGDRIDKIDDYSIHSQADISWALHNAPEAGKIQIRFRRDGTPRLATIQLDHGWKETNLSWRASMRDEKMPQRMR